MSTQEAITASALAELDAELAAFNTEETERNARVHRARLLDQALRSVRDAEENAKRLTLTIARLEAAMIIVGKIEKLADTIEDDTPGAFTILRDGYAAPGQQDVSCLGTFLGDTAQQSLRRLKAERDETEAALRRTEQRLTDAQAHLASLR